MEPMTLGSPVNSPGGGNSQYPYNYSQRGLGLLSPSGSGGQIHNQHASLGGGHQPTTPNHHQPMGSGTGFLPGFLMGDCTQQGAGRMVSPTKLNRSMSHQSAGGTHLVGTPGTPVPAGQRINGFLTPTTPAGSGTPSSSMRNSQGGGGQGGPDKPGGPPTKGLFSTPTHSQHLSRVLDTTGPQVNSPLAGTPRGANGTPMPSTPHLSFGGTPRNFNSTHDSSLSTDGSNTTWVTVFGFPPSAASYILKQFSQCGTVLQHHVPVNGNWMSIRYQTRNQAQSALSRSGRVLSGTLMIGVSLTPDAEAQALSNGAEGILDGSGAPGAVGNPNTSVTTLNNTSINGGTPNRSIRPLAQAYKAAQSEHELSMSSTATSKNDGIVTRAMGCIFGW